MNYKFILWIAALLCLSQQIDARTQRLVFADEAGQQGEIVAAGVQSGKPEEQIENTQNADKNDKTEVEVKETKHECAEQESEDDENNNILIIDADELQRILELAAEAQGRATRRYNLRLRRGPSRGNRRRPLVRGGRRRAGLRRVRPNRTRTRNGNPVRRATIRRRTG